MDTTIAYDTGEHSSVTDLLHVLKQVCFLSLAYLDCNYTTQGRSFSYYGQNFISLWVLNGSLLAA